VLTTDGHDGAVYELTGDTAWSYPELAAEISRIGGREVTDRDLSLDEHRATLRAAGMPEPIADLDAGFDQEIARGALADVSDQLRTLIGRPTTPLAETPTEALTLT
jgi:NAD(P)H dehydrogenase (quinone)